MFEFRANRRTYGNDFQRHRSDCFHSYSYRVRATDAANNLSGSPTTASASSLLPDTTRRLHQQT